MSTSINLFSIFSNSGCNRYSSGMYNTALMKIWVAVIFTILLNYLCSLGLGTISWFIVFIPFILMTVIVAILLLMFGLDPASGKMKIKKDNKDDSIMDYYKKKDSSLGGETEKQEIDEEEEEETVKEETKKEKNLEYFLEPYFYKDEIDDEEQVKKYSKKIEVAGKTVYESSEDIDLRPYKSGVDTVSNILYGMGEQNIAAI